MEKTNALIILVVVFFVLMSFRPLKEINTESSTNSVSSVKKHNMEFKLLVVNNWGLIGLMDQQIVADSMATQAELLKSEFNVSFGNK